MSRDHYKGVRKTRNLVVDADGNARALSSLYLDGDTYPLSKVLNVGSVNAAGAVTTLYVRATGSDTDGDGSAEKPFATIPAAFDAIPTFLRNQRYVIDCTGLGNVTLPAISDSEFRTRTFISGDPGTNNFANVSGEVPFYFLDSITVSADPTILATIDQSNITGTSVNAITGAITLETNLNLTLNQYKGKLISTNSAFPGITAIASNTAGPNSEIVLPSTYFPTGASGDFPVRVLEPSCTLQGAKFTWRNNLCGLTLSGLELDEVLTINGTPAPGIQLQVCVFNGGLSFYGPGTDPGVNASYCYFNGGSFSTLGCPFIFFDNVFDSMTFDFRGTTAGDAATIGQSIFNACGTIRGSSGQFPTGDMSIILKDSTLQNGTGDAVFVGPSDVADFVDLDISGYSGNGIVVDGSRVDLTRVTTTTANTGIGLVLTNGAQAKVSTNTTVSGAGGAYKVGDNAATAAVSGWTALGSSQENDLGATDPELCRLFR